MNAPSSPENSSDGSAALAAVPRAEFYKHLKAVADISWKNGILFMALLVALFAFLKSAYRWDGDQYTLLIPVIFLWLLLNIAQNKRAELDQGNRNLKAISEAMGRSGMIATAFFLSLFPLLVAVLKWDGTQYEYFRLSFFLGVFFVLAHNRCIKIYRGMESALPQGPSPGH